jgi:hypothetical protein
MKQSDAELPTGKIDISLYEFYAMGINTLLMKAPWEHAARISSYKDSALHEQQLISLAVLYLFGEEYIPESVVHTMPEDYAEQIRDSVNQAVFSKALKNHFRSSPTGDKVAVHMMQRMTSYITAFRHGEKDKGNPLEDVTELLAKRVPPQSDEQYEKYFERVKQIFGFTEKMVTKSLSEKYKIVS